MSSVMSGFFVVVLASIPNANFVAALSWRARHHSYWSPMPFVIIHFTPRPASAMAPKKSLLASPKSFAIC